MQSASSLPTATPSRWMLAVLGVLRTRDGVAFTVASVLVLAVKAGLLANVPW